MIDPAIYRPAGMHEIARRLGIPAISEKRLHVRLDWLEASEGFPPALPGNRPRERCYDRRAVDAWFDARIPEQLRDAALGGEVAGWSDILDRRAAAIGAGGVADIGVAALAMTGALDLVH